MKRPSRKRAAILGAVLLGALPIWTVPLAAAGTVGFVGYLQLSNAYYTVARQVFGAALFPIQEFGIAPRAAGLALAAASYAAVGAAIGWALGGSRDH